MRCETILKALVRDGNRFRSTPVVSDDFPEMKFQFDNMLHQATKFIEEFKRPQIVCLCGSTRFSDAFRAANLKLTLAGVIVLSIGCDTKSDDGLKLTKQDKDALDELHKRKIDLADSILVLNVGGYIGESTASEIRYAEMHAKEILYLEAIR